MSNSSGPVDWMSNLRPVHRPDQTPGPWMFPSYTPSSTRSDPIHVVSALVGLGPAECYQAPCAALVPTRWSRHRCSVHPRDPGVGAHVAHHPGSAHRSRSFIPRNSTRGHLTGFMGFVGWMFDIPVLMHLRLTILYSDGQNSTVNSASIY